MNKVLFIAYLYPPIANSGTQRSVKFSKYLGRFGWKPYVLTGTNPMGNNVDKKLLDEVSMVKDIFRVPMTSEITISNWTKYLPDSLAGFITDKLVWRLREKNKFPDIYGDWIEAATEKGIQIVTKNKLDLIYASGVPWSSFVVAKKISSKTGVPFIIDYRDLWTEDYAQFGNKIVSNKELNLELELLNSANHVITVTNSIGKVLSEKINNNSEKITVITNGFDDDEFTIETETKENGKFSFGYIGVWKENYNPEQLIMSINKLSDAQAIQVEFIGAGFDIEKVSKITKKNTTIECLGYIPHSKAVKLMKELDCLFVTTPDSDYSQLCLPGKIFEYLGSGTPVLAYIDADSELWKFLEKTGGALLVDKKEPEKLDHIIRKIAETRIIDCPAINKNELWKYERKNLTKNLAITFNKVLESSNVKVNA